MLKQTRKKINGRDAIVVSGLGNYDLKDTFECGQCFRYELVTEEDGYIEYITVAHEKVMNVGQKTRGELIFYGISEEDLKTIAVPYFSLDVDFEEIKKDVLAHTESEFLKKAAEAASGIAILKQEPWEALISFIISQNNNIPRIRKMIKRLASEYGVNICLQNGVKECPLRKEGCIPCEEICKNCGVCYTFPTAESIAKNPEGLLVSNPGFRYKYLCGAVEKINTGAINLDMISIAGSYSTTKECLMKIKGVGEKVASCVALFGFGNLEAFPIDVWMKRAIDEHFDGSLDPQSLGKYAGVAQQYIFHYIRNLEEKT